ncbi:MAG: hypothetical protein V3W11_12880 [bacterium]
MVNLVRNVSPMALVLVFLILCVSFAWGIPAGAPAAEGEADVAPKDPWAGVKISDAYDDLRCPYCWGYNELTAARCPSCGYEFRLPSGEYTYPPWVFVPGKGYYREGTLLEPGKSRKGYWITGLVLTASGLTVGALAGYYGGDIGGAIAALPCLAAIAVGVPLLIYGLATRTEAVYAFESGERYEPYERPAFALRSPGSDGGGLKIEVTLLGF